MTAIATVLEPVKLGPTWLRDDAGKWLLPERTLGWQVIDWCMDNLLQPDGPDAGGAWRFTPEQARIVLWWYAVDAAGRFTYRDGIIQRLKGWGKDPFAAALCMVEFVGPCRFGGWGADGSPVGVEHPAAWIQVAAVSRDQTRNTMTLFPGMISKQIIKAKSLDLGKEVIYAEHGRRRIEAVTSSPRALEGGRSTFVVRNEALATDTLIPTASGWAKMGELIVGDVIFGSDGAQTVVTAAHPVQFGRRCFKVTFRDDTSIVASDGHLWQTRVMGSAAKPKVRTTLEMFEDGRRFGVPRSGPRQTANTDLPVDPYLLGVWLGDGSKGQPNITVGDEDLAELQVQLKERGIESHELSRTPGKAARIGFSNRTGFGASMGTDIAKALRSLPCYRDKHIPAEYLAAGVEQRLELLRGLMDTDGCADTAGQCIFVGRKALVDGVVELLRSLGQITTPQYTTDTRSRDGGYWRVSFRPYGIQPFAFPRKAARVVGTVASTWVGIASITEVDSVPVRCISVAADDHLFQAGVGGHSTHNTHHWLLNNEGIAMSEVINRNLVKSRDGSARAISITNAWEPGEDSVAERQRMGYELVQAGKANAAARSVLYDSLEAPEGVDLQDEPLLRAAIAAVRGDATWLDIDNIVGDIYDPLTPPSRARRFYLNTAIGSESKWVAADVVDERSAEVVVPAGAWITLGFDGSISQDSTVLTGCTEDGHLFNLGMWERPKNNLLAEGWRVPADEVDEAVAAAFKRFNVRRMYCDPQYWQSNIGDWIVLHGEEVVLEWWTNNRDTAMARALEQLHTALLTEQVTLDPELAPHFKNAHVFYKGSEENRLTLIRKERRGSPNKIDGAMSATLAYEARNDAVAAGLFVRQKKRTKVYGF